MRKLHYRDSSVRATPSRTSDAGDISLWAYRLTGGFGPAAWGCGCLGGAWSIMASDS
jgi:hypothetical protein